MIESIGVIGAGQMGAGIAQVAAQAGLSVSLSDVAEDSLEAGRSAVQKSLSRLRRKDVLSQQQCDDALARIAWSTTLESHREKEFVIEAVVENEAVKTSVFSKLDEICGAETIFASNTSSISITRLAANVKSPGRFIGMHFMNPVPLMKLVEVIRGLNTSEATYAATVSLAERLGKTTTLSQDFPGFIANRILMPMINEAFFALMEGVGSAEDIDTTLLLGANQPMGPLALADLIGLDTCLSIMLVLHRELGDSKYRPCPLLRKHVDAGRLGRKTGRGVFEYA
jgi:3-hydroxybutyryl-CoA dehydrogenase